MDCTRNRLLMLSDTVLGLKRGCYYTLIRLLLSNILPLEPNTSVANYIEPLAGPINDFIEPL